MYVIYIHYSQDLFCALEFICLHGDKEPHSMKRDLFEGMEFGRLLRQHRRARKLTLQELAAKVGNFHSNLSALERSRARVGTRVAIKLADALQLRATEREEFLAAAFAESNLGGLTAENLPLVQEILRAIRHGLAQRGTEFEQILPIKSKDGRELLGFKAIVPKAPPIPIEIRLQDGQGLALRFIDGSPSKSPSTPRPIKKLNVTVQLE